MFALSLLLCAFQSPDYSVVPRPTWVEPAALDVQAEVPDGGVIGGIYRALIDTQVRFVDGKRSSYEEYAWYVVDSQGVQNGSQISIDFDPSYHELELHVIEVVRDGVTLDRIDTRRIQVLQREEDLDARIYDGSRTLIAFLEDVRPGDLVRYAFTLEGANPAFAGHFMGGAPMAAGSPVGRIRHRLLWRSDRELTVHVSGSVPEPVIREHDGLREYVWDLHQVPAVQIVQSPPVWYYGTPWIQFTSFQDWAEVARWEVGLLALPPETGPELAREIDAIRAAHAEPEERALAAVRFVQDEIRYLGIELGVGAYEPSAPDEVHGRRYGDCKDKSLLLATMLRALGVQSRLALVSWGLLHTVSEYAPSPTLFDHVIVRVDLPTGPVWVDPTEALVGGDLADSEPAPFGLALVVEESTVELLPVSNGGERGMTRVNHLIDALEVGQPADLRVTTTYEGGDAARMRENYGWTTPDRYSKRCLEYYRNYYETAEAVAPVEIQDDLVADVFKTTEHYSIPGFWERGDGFWSAHVYAIEMNDQLPSLSSTSDGHPVGLGYPSRLEQSIVVHLDGGWEFEPESSILENDGFRFSANVGSSSGKDGSRFRFDFTYRAKADHVIASDLGKVIEDLEAANEFMDYQLSHADSLPSEFGELGDFDADKLFAALTKLGETMRPGSAGEGEPEDLATLFKDWRDFEQPPMVDGAPDYTAARMSAASAELRSYQRRLQAIDRSGWSVEQQADWHIVRAEMNGLDFNCRVLRPWTRDPAFYQTIWSYQSDTPAHEGPANHALLELWTYRFPLSAAEEERLIAELGVIRPLLAQARRNLVGNARELWVAGIRNFRIQEADLESIRQRAGGEVSGELESAIRSAELATREFIRWLESQAPSKTGPSGVGKEHYTWYQQNVHLLPMTWEDEVRLLQRELDRAWASLRLEEQRNRDLPQLVPVASPEEYDRRADAAAHGLMTFLRETNVLPVKDNMEPALRQHLGSFVPEAERNFFWIGAHLDPTPLYTHFYHWWDLAQIRDEPHESPIRRGPLLYNIFDSRSEGVATGVEEMFLHAGLYDDNPRAREIVWIMLAQRAARGLGSLHAHANEMTMAEAGAVHVEWTPRGWMTTEPELLQFEQHLYMRQPGYGTSYITGKYMFERLLAHVSKQAEDRGEKFVLSDFFDEMNDAGCIPMSLIRWQMTGLDDEIEFLLDQ